MLISFNWLKQYVKLPDSVAPEEVAEKLKLSTVEVEKIDRPGGGLAGIVVGKVLAADKHPNADKLKVCTVDVGEEKLSIVCGGSNVVAGMLVAVAKIGARVRWHGAGEPVEMKEAEIRGVKSYGMICASTEIGLGEMFPLQSEREILDLTDKLKATRPGAPLDSALGLNDAVLEIDNKSLSNRPDLWGHYGIAREVAALFKKDLQPYEAPEIHPVKSSLRGGREAPFKGVKVKVEDKKLCPRYMAAAVAGVKVAPSPAWLAQKLSAVGLRPINNIVDITNYIMLDLGEPMHAFDAAKLQTKKSNQATIVVRRAQDCEVFKTLDGADRRLDSDMLVIANEEKPVALAGIMGGEESGIDESTETVIFEAANFEAAAIRRASARLGLRTDSSARFEKALDPNLCAMALRRAVELTLQFCPGARVASGVADEKSFHLFKGPIELDYETMKRKIGAEIDAKEAAKILERLGFGVKTKKTGLSVAVPSWRATKDVSLPEDLLEEIIRVFGFENIPSALPDFPIAPPEKNRLRALEHRLRRLLAAELAYNEVYNYSFVSGAQIKNLGDGAEKYIELDNPMSKEKPFLRRALLPNLLENLRQNIELYPEVKIAEIGKVYIAEEGGARESEGSDALLPKQDNYLTAVYSQKKDKVPFWQARRAWETVAADLNLEFELTVVKTPAPWQHPARAAEILTGDKAVGAVYELNPQAAARYGLETAAGIMEINLDKLLEYGKMKARVFAPSPAYPDVERDLSLLIKKTVTNAEIVAALSGFDPLLSAVELFDAYEGSTIGEEYKSLAYHFVYRHPERTLTAAEADEVQERAIKFLEKKFSATVRK